ncbi:hypothetical protein AAF712_013073 [Marasmius tenuissimus]|uniref:Uncharacterized protein n=1 Tax=Marasmius tenuissimus TaxID=585030 RepID=A0ABR2ZI91_9AGAR
MNDDALSSDEKGNHMATIEVAGRKFLIERAGASLQMYECPECRIPGSLSAVMKHFEDVHDDIIRARGRKTRNVGDEPPAKKPRMGHAPSSPSSSPPRQTPSSHVGKPVGSQTKTAQSQLSQSRPSQDPGSQSQSTAHAPDAQLKQLQVHVGSSDSMAVAKPNSTAAPKSISAMAGKSNLAVRAKSKPVAAAAKTQSKLLFAPAAPSATATSASPRSTSSATPSSTAHSSRPSPAPSSRPTPAPSSRPTPPPSSRELFQEPTKADGSLLRNLKDNHEVTGVKLQGEDIFAGYETRKDIFVFLSGAMEQVVNICPVHYFLLPKDLDSGNHPAWQCTEMCAAIGSYFKDVFCPALNVQPLVTCTICLTPIQTSHESFDHIKRCTKGRLPDRSNWQGWWRWVPYVVWRTKALRDVVFPAMGLSPDHFRELLDYAHWLSFPCYWTHPGSRSGAITNLFAVVFVFFTLSSRKKCMIPRKGFMLDVDLPLISSLHDKYRNTFGHDI